MKLLEKIFPAAYDFYGMLEAQTRHTAQGVQAMAAAVAAGAIDEDCPLFSEADRADQVRMDMEQKLVDAFTTPFDRQDIYSISVEMDRIIETVKSSVLAMLAYQVEPDEVVIHLSRCLSEGLEQLVEAVCLLPKDHKAGESKIPAMRAIQKNTEAAYRQGMARLFAASQPMEAMRKREVYRHLRDAAEFFGLTVDRYHKIVVRQV